MRRSVELVSALSVLIIVLIDILYDLILDFFLALNYFSVFVFFVCWFVKIEIRIGVAC